MPIAGQNRGPRYQLVLLNSVTGQQTDSWASYWHYSSIHTPAYQLPFLLSAQNKKTTCAHLKSPNRNPKRNLCHSDQCLCLIPLFLDSQHFQYQSWSLSSLSFWVTKKFRIRDLYFRDLYMREQGSSQEAPEYFRHTCLKGKRKHNATLTFWLLSYFCQRQVESTLTPISNSKPWGQSFMKNSQDILVNCESIGLKNKPVVIKHSEN